MINRFFILMVCVDHTAIDGGERKGFCCIQAPSWCKEHSPVLEDNNITSEEGRWSLNPPRKKLHVYYFRVSWWIYIYVRRDSISFCVLPAPSGIFPHTKEIDHTLWIIVLTYDYTIWLIIKCQSVRRKCKLLSMKTQSITLRTFWPSWQHTKESLYITSPSNCLTARFCKIKCARFGIFLPRLTTLSNRAGLIF